MRFPATRLVGLVVTLLVSSFLIYSSLYLTPGDPISTLSGGRTLPPEAVQALSAQHHLDDPFFIRYLAWLGDVIRGDLGESLVFNTTVTDLLAAREQVQVRRLRDFRPRGAHERNRRRQRP